MTILSLVNKISRIVLGLNRFIFSIKFPEEILKLTKESSYPYPNSIFNLDIPFIRLKLIPYS